MDLLHAYGREGGDAADYNKHNTTLNIQAKKQKWGLHTTKNQRYMF